MHLLASQAGVIDGAAEAIDLDQAPGDIVFLSAADSELAALAHAHDRMSEPKPSLRLANFLQLQHNLSVDTYVEKTLSGARLIVLRLLGGESYWPYGLGEIEAVAQQAKIALAVMPGDGRPDPDLYRRSTLSHATCALLHRYLASGGSANAGNFLRACARLVGFDMAAEEPQEFPLAGIYRDTSGACRPLAGLVFYRSVVEGGQTAPIDALVEALDKRGIACRALYVASLKERESAELIASSFEDAAPDIILNGTAFAASGAGGGGSPFDRFDCPVLQVILAGTSEEQWRASMRGLGPRDLAMNVVLPELDGRIITRAISFKADALWHEPTQCRVVTYRPVQDRVDYVADLAAAWIRLRRTKPADRKIAIVLANYPNKDGRIGNGVGYDTPASTVAILDALKGAGYAVGDFPENGNALISDLQNIRSRHASEGWHSVTRCRAGGDSEDPSFRRGDGCLRVEKYRIVFGALPPSVRDQINNRWGDPESDSFFADDAFHFPLRLYGNVAVAIQPARGYNIDPKASYHDPALPPPHGYLAFYFWLRHHFGAHAVIHNGKHGNLEWLPGKAAALSSACLPEAALGPLPQLYPFIVNDPGEGSQAKRRSSAVIIDHLTPPLTRAETYGPLKDLEALLDEYYLASGLDRRRVEGLRRDILELTRGLKLDMDAGFTGEDTTDLQKLDAFLCDLKEAQIRDGLHVLGSSPMGPLETDLLVALVRAPRRLGEGRDASLIRALAADLGLGDFDPLACAMAEPWIGPQPKGLAELSSDAWRTAGDTVERLELLAFRLVASLSSFPTYPIDTHPSESRGPMNRLARGSATRDASFRWHDGKASERTRMVLDELRVRVIPALRACGGREIEALLAGLDGRFVRPGPSGAPTRGRLDVLPTGRNFYSLDNRTVPTPTAWRLGEASARALLDRHFQDFGRHPAAIGLSAWGTSNMRTGGDDIAQALALIGTKPVWEPSSWRVTGFEVVPIAQLGRPRVDVTLRISGFFRDAFPAQIELLDKAIRTVGALDEDNEDNPIAARMRAEAEGLIRSGIADNEARHIAGYRIFGAKPGAYGAGLQALIDEKIWSGRADLAQAYVAWGAYAYGARDQGVNDERAFTRRLSRIEAVVHNQDNREHDLLDSDDYYQFEGGMSAAVEHASGTRPRVYHNDHSRPERPQIRTLEEEIGRVMRSRVVNPKWIAGVKRHGYKGAFEIAATVDYMFAFAATTGAVKTHHFDLAYDAFLADEETRAFIFENNPAALREIAERFEEAAMRGLWSPRLNSAHRQLKLLREGAPA